MVGGLLGSRTTLVSTFLAAGTFAFSTAAVGWRGLGAEMAVVEVGAAVRVLADEGPVTCAVVDGLARDPELEDAALRTGLFGSAGEGRGEVVVDFDGGSVRVFPDLVAVAALFVLLEVNIDFVGDFGATAVLGATGFGFGFGFSSALTGFAGSSTSFPMGIESSSF